MGSGMRVCWRESLYGDSLGHSCKSLYEGSNMCAVAQEVACMQVNLACEISHELAQRYMSTPALVQESRELSKPMGICAKGCTDTSEHLVQ